MEQREIKFRGQRIDNKQWVYGFYVISRARHEGWEESGCWFSIHVETSDLEEPSSYKVHPETVGQYTGLKDKKLLEIYESDIVQCGYGKGVVIFHAGCFMVEWIDDKEANMEFLFSRNGRSTRRQDDEFEIIGNIYEHPHLLTVEAIADTKK